MDLYTEITTLLAVLVLAYFGHNMTVVYATGIVLALKVISLLGLTAPLAALGVGRAALELEADEILMPVVSGKTFDRAEMVAVAGLKNHVL